MSRVINSATKKIGKLFLELRNLISAYRWVFDWGRLRSSSVKFIDIFSFSWSLWLFVVVVVFALRDILYALGRTNRSVIVVKVGSPRMSLLDILFRWRDRVLVELQQLYCLGLEFIIWIINLSPNLLFYCLPCCNSGPSPPFRFHRTSCSLICVLESAVYPNKLYSLTTTATDI